MVRRAFYDALSPEQRRASLPGRGAIATLLPEQQAEDSALTHLGDVTQFSSPKYIMRNIGGQTAKPPLPGVDHLNYEDWVVQGRNGYTEYYHVLNAENIHVQGEASGLPVLAAASIGALTNATTAANSAFQYGGMRVRA